MGSSGNLLNLQYIYGFYLLLFPLQYRYIITELFAE